MAAAGYPVIERRDFPGLVRGRDRIVVALLLTSPTIRAGVARGALRQVERGARGDLRGGIFGRATDVESRDRRGLCCRRRTSHGALKSGALVVIVAVTYLELQDMGMPRLVRRRELLAGAGAALIVSALPGCSVGLRD